MSETKKRVSRPYRITDKLTGDVMDVTAYTATQAINFATYDRFEIHPMTVKEALHSDPKLLRDATIPGVHPDQQPLPGV